MSKLLLLRRRTIVYIVFTSFIVTTTLALLADVVNKIFNNFQKICVFLQFCDNFATLPTKSKGMPLGIPKFVTS